MAKDPNRAVDVEKAEYSTHSLADRRVHPNIGHDISPETNPADDKTDLAARLSQQSSTSTIVSTAAAGAEPSDPTHAKDAIAPPPDGGLVAWLQVLSALFANALTWGFSTGFGIFQAYYVQHLDHSASDIAWIGSLQSFLFFFIGAFSGRATDAGLTRVTVLAGSCLLVFGIFMTSLATEYWQIVLAQGICVGVGGGFLFIPVLAVVGSYFTTRKTFAVGMGAAGTGVGGLVFPALVQHLIPKIGFAWAVRCMGFVALAMAIIMNICLKPRLPPRKSGPLLEPSAFKEPIYAFYSAGAFLIFWALFVGFAYINLYAREVFHLPDTEAVNLLLIMNGVGIPSRLILNYCADRWTGQMNAMIPASASLSLMFFAWTAISDRTGLYVFAVFYGIAASGTQGLFAGSLASVTPDLSRLGVRMGMVFALCAFSSLTGSPIAGAISALEGGRYTGSQVWAGVMVIVGSACLLGARLSRTGLVLWVKA